MGNTIANVLVGTATLGIRQPNDAIAEWSDVNPYTGTYSVKLTKTGSGNAGSTHLEIIPPTSVTLGTFNTGVGGAASYDFWYCDGVAAVVGNFLQIELRFDDPNSDGHVDITAVPFQGDTADGIWTAYDLNTDPAVGYYGANEVGTRMDDWTLATATITNVRAIIGNLCVGASDDAADDWICTRVRFELWEAEPARFVRVDSVRLQGVLYTIEPGGTAPGMSLSSPFTDVGYTEDGVTIEYTADEADIEVEEETFPVDRVITKETVAITCNMAESSLYNIDKSMAGAVLSGSILTLGNGVNKTMNLKIKGKTPGTTAVPAGFIREILIPLATATGAVGMSYKKGEKTMVPVTFQALKGDSPAVTIVDNAA